MFTGIIESMGQLQALRPEGSNLHLTFSSNFTEELKIDQSLAHNGVCLTVVAIDEKSYTVTAIDETLKRSNLGHLQIGDQVNLERCMSANGRFDGHIVQGHVDTMGTCQSVLEKDGSWEFQIQYPKNPTHITVEKGSITINGVSLTVVDSEEDWFSVAIIPYTYEHTSFRNLKAGDPINLEFDVVGKYVARILGKTS